MQQLGHLKQTVSLWRGLQSKASNLLELTELALAEEDYSLAGELQAEADEISATLAREEINLTLSGTYDDRSTIVSVYAGGRGDRLPGLG